jgi:hypothetical protein
MSGRAAAKTESLKRVLEEEKVLLKTKLRERDHQIECDAIALKVSARGKTMSQLDE